MARPPSCGGGTQAAGVHPKADGEAAINIGPRRAPGAPARPGQASCQKISAEGRPTSGILADSEKRPPRGRPRFFIVRRGCENGRKGRKGGKRDRCRIGTKQVHQARHLFPAVFGHVIRNPSSFLSVGWRANPTLTQYLAAPSGGSTDMSRALISATPRRFYYFFGGKHRGRVEASNKIGQSRGHFFGEKAGTRFCPPRGTPESGEGATGDPQGAKRNFTPHGIRPPESVNR